VDTSKSLILHRRNFIHVNSIQTVIFDLGGVLIDWNPRYLYRKIFETEGEINWFLENICTSEWNDQQDAGRTFAEATEELISRHPGWEQPIRAWYDRWEETISGPIEGTVEILAYLRRSNHRLYALTNWSAESFPIARRKFEFLHWFEGIVVSGMEKTRKPFPEFYRILFNRYTIEPTRSLFIDDNKSNIEAGKDVGLNVIHFQSPQQLREDLRKFGITI